MIVLINQFFKHIITNKILSKELLQYRDFITSRIPIQFYSSNIVDYKKQDEINKSMQTDENFDIKDFYSEEDVYAYIVHKLDDETNKYVNTLMLDRVNDKFVFKNKSRLFRNIKYYIDYRANNKLKDYNILLAKLQEEMI